MGTLDTRDVPKHDRHDYWAHAVSHIFARLEVVPAKGQEVNCRLAWRDIGQARMTYASGSPQSVCRTSAAIASDQAAHIILMFQQDGFVTLLHRGRSVNLEPGSIVALDTRSPYRLSFLSRFEQRVLRVPTDILGARVDDTAPLTATALKPSFASRFLMAGFSATEPACADSSSDLELPLLDLTRLALYRGMPTFQPRTQSDRLRLAQGYINTHLGLADLTPQHVAVELGLSLRTLQKVFAQAGETPASYIQEQRLIKISEYLRRPEHASRSIGQIAQSVGFPEPSHFTRAFRERFGMSPREWRHKHQL